MLYIMKRSILFLLLTGLLLLTSGAAALTLSPDGAIHGYDENRLTVEAEEAGKLTVRVTSLGCSYGSFTRQVEAGENELTWDGLGLYGEPLPDGKYTLEAELETEAGR